MVKGDGRGGKRPNAGRKRKRFYAELDDQLITMLTEQYQEFCAWEAENMEYEDYTPMTLATFFDESIRHFIMQGKFKP